MTTYRVPTRGAARLASRRRWSPEPKPWWLIVVIAVGMGIPLLAAALSGNLAIPHNDSWAYSRITSTFWRTGQIHLLNYNDMSLIGQLFVVGPLGRWLVAQQLGIFILAVFAVWCCYRLTASMTTVGRGLLAAVALVVWPGFASLSSSFMTDVPTLAASLASVMVGRVALRKDSRRLFVLALVIGFWGGTVRQVALTAPAALVLVALWTAPSRSALTRRFLIGACAIFGIALIAFTEWRLSMPNGQEPKLSMQLSSLPGKTLDDAEAMYFTLAVFLAPLTLFVARPHRWRWPSWLCVGVVALLTVRVLLLHYQFALGDYFSATGEYSYDFGTHVAVPPLLWDLVTPLAIVGGLALAGELAANWRRVDPVLGVFTVLAFLAVLAVAVAYWPLFDRYLLPVMPGVAAVVLAAGLTTGDDDTRGGLGTVRGAQELLRTAEAPLRAAAAVSFVVLGLMSVLLATNSFAFDSARWKLADKVAATGIPRNRVDAGIEWDGWQSTGPMTTYPWIFSGVHGDFGWSRDFLKAPPCVVLTVAPLPPGPWADDRGTFTLIKIEHYHTYLVAGRSPLYVYRTNIPGCPRVTRANA